MTKELNRTSKTPAAVESQPTDVATSPMHLGSIQQQLVEWCKEKQEEMNREYWTLEDAIQEAKKGDFRTRSLKAAQNKVIESIEFYDKVAIALDAGYMLFPPIGGWNIEILAIRSEDGRHGFERTLEATWARNPGGVQAADVLSAGDGSYVSPNVHWQKGGIEKVPSGQGTVDRQVWYPLPKLGAPEFPLVMARSQVIEATNRAMVELVFDDIAIYPARARKDPVILGRIYDPKRSRWLNFLISWRVDKRDL